MHLMLFNFILLLLLPNPTLQSRVTFATSRQISPSQHWAAQTCNNVGVTNCCAPLNLNVPGVGHGWFRASYIQFSNLPPVSLYLSVWRAQGTGYSCKGATAGDETADGGTDIEYSDTSAVGLGGAWYTEWVSNKTVVAASPEVLHPDQVFYQGEIYMEQNKGMGIFYGPNGKLIFGLPFSGGSQRLRKPTISNNLSGGGWLQLKKPNLTKDLSGGGAGQVEYNAAPVSPDTSK